MSHWDNAEPQDPPDELDLAPTLQLRRTWHEKTPWFAVELDNDNIGEVREVEGGWQIAGNERIFPNLDAAIVALLDALATWEVQQAEAEEAARAYQDDTWRPDVEDGPDPEDVRAVVAAHPGGTFDSEDLPF